MHFSFEVLLLMIIVSKAFVAYARLSHRLLFDIFQFGDYRGELA